MAKILFLVSIMLLSSYLTEQAKLSHDNMIDKSDIEANTLKDQLFDYQDEQVPDERPTRYCASCVKPCGTKPGPRLASPRIVNGNDTRENEFGWAAMLKVRGKFSCGGTLITKKHVLTAAHCVNYKNIVDLTVTIGEHDRTVETGRESVHHVTQIHQHHNYKPESHLDLDNDIAIIELREPVPINSPWVRVACLPKSADTSYEGIMGTAIGWGRLGEGRETSNILQKVDLPIISNADCKYKMGYYQTLLTRNMMCAGDKEGQPGVCNGDSGGAMHRHIDPSGTMEVIGIVSWSYGCARKNHPGVYTRVANYLDWIMNHIGDECICGAESS